MDERVNYSGNPYLQLTYNYEHIDAENLYFEDRKFFKQNDGSIIEEEFYVFPTDSIPRSMHISSVRNTMNMSKMEERVVMFLGKFEPMERYVRTTVNEGKDFVFINLETGNIDENDDYVDDAAAMQMDISISKELLEENKWFRELVDRMLSKDNAKVYTTTGASNMFIEANGTVAYLPTDYESDEP